MNSTVSPVQPFPAKPMHEAEATVRLAWYAAVAVHAPSKHNTQPWRFVVKDGWLELWTDLERSLPVTDPRRRELVISCGAALHLAEVAVRALGYTPSVTVLGNGSHGLVATLVEGEPWETTESDLRLLDAVATRRTDRGPLDGSVLAPSLPFHLQSAAAAQGATLRLVSTPGDRATLAGLVERADRLLAKRGEADSELSGWLRAPDDPRGDGVPSTHARGAAASYRAEFVQRDFSSPESQPTHDREGVDHPLLAVLTTGGDRHVDWVVAGRALGAVLLCAAASGAHASYLNQPVEEEPSRTELQRALSLGGHAQLVLRLGRGGLVLPTPRRHLDELIS